MTVVSQRTTHRYLGDGVQNLWPILFKFLDPEHVRALKTSVDGATTSLVYGSEYTVEVLEGGGQCSAQLKDGEQITLYLDVPLTQETDLRDSGRLAPDVLERMVDKLTLALQQQKEDVERCVRVPPESAETPDDYVKQIIDVKEQAVQLKGTAESAVAETLAYKELSEEQVGRAVAEVAKAQRAVDDAEQILGSVQSAVSGLDTSIRESVSEEITPVVKQARAEFDVIKNQVVGYRNQSAQHVALATEKVTIAERVVGDADKLLSEARVLITRAEQLVEDTASGSGSELLSGMVIPFKGTLTGSGFPLDRITGAENRQYAVCDGRTYIAPDGTRITTPDLRDRFITGAGRTYSQGNIGGVNNVVLSVEQLPAHTHSLRAGTGDTSGEYTFNDIATVVRSKTGMRTVTAAGGSKPHENRPPYYALAYLMKL